MSKPMGMTADFRILRPTPTEGGPMFRNPDEWRRAREAWIHMALLDDRTLAVSGSRPGLEAEWAREFPCPPEPDRAEVERAVDDFATLAGHYATTDAEYYAARSRLLALYTEPVPASRTDGAAGEVLYDRTIYGPLQIASREETMHFNYQYPIRVRVTRVEGEAK